MSPDFNVRSINGDRAIVETESPLPAMGQSPAVSRPAVVESAGDGKRGQKSRESHDERYGLLPSDSDDEDGEVLVPSVESCPNGNVVVEQTARQTDRQTDRQTEDGDATADR